MNSRSAQLVDVAERAQVAKSTVAAALRPGGGGKNARVSKATAERIRRIAHEMGYQPNRLARGLRGASTSSVAAVWQFVDPWCLDSNVGNRLLSCFQDDGLATYQADHPTKVPKLVGVLSDLLNRRPDALVIRMRPDMMKNQEVLNLLGAFKAVVAVVPWAIENCRFDQVIHDRDVGICAAVEHFARTGRKRPAIVVNLRDMSDQRKLQTFVDHCRRLGIEDHATQLLDLGRVVPDSDSRIERYTAVIDRNFPGEIDVDAILVVNDLGVMTVAKCLRDRGVQVGRDVALIGLNNPPQLSLWAPPLASIDRNQDLLLETIHQLVSQRMSQADLPPQRRLVPMQFCWRESAGGDPPSP